MIKSRRGHSMEEGVTLNLDSLVDIVSNSVGILIILAVFMALFSYLEFTPETTPDTRVSENPEKILIPWAHYSQKTALLFLVRDNRILRLDRSEYYRKIRKQLNGPNPSPPQSLSFEKYRVELETHGGHNHCLEFHPSPGAGLWWHQFTGSQGPLENLTREMRPEENYFFFWVDPDSFELFRELRHTLWSKDFEVGWKPVREQSSLRYCTGDSRSRSFRPQ